eukprot:999642-Rhodomonas_salina.3
MPTGWWQGAFEEGHLTDWLGVRTQYLSRYARVMHLLLVLTSTMILPGMSLTASGTEGTTRMCLRGIWSATPSICQSECYHFSDTDRAHGGTRNARTTIATR